MKITIVSGMLGAGKTTFIQQYLRDAGERAVVLVNDFGKAGIDGEIFSRGGIESIELPSGCVCCTLKFDLITTVQRIIDTLSPEHLVIEPSGVASPSGVLEALEGVLAGTVTVVGLVDATEFRELYESGMYGTFFQDQIVNADIILVNKADIAGKTATNAAVEIVQGLNPHAVVFRTVRAIVNGPLPETPENRRRLHPFASHFHFDTLSLKLKDGVALSRIHDFFADMASGRYGDVVRAKALVRTGEGAFRFDLSYGKVQSAPFANDLSGSRIVVIGEKLERQAMTRLFGE